MANRLNIKAIGIKGTDSAELAVRAIAAIAVACWLAVVAFPLPKPGTPSLQSPTTNADHQASEKPQITLLIAPPAQVDRPLYVWNSALDDPASLPASLPVVAGSEVLLATDTEQPLRVMLDETPVAPLARSEADPGGPHLVLATISQKTVLSFRVGRKTLKTRLQVEPDHAPKAELTETPMLTQRGLLRFAIKAQDDLGLATVRLHFSGDKRNGEIISHPLTVPMGATEVKDIAFVDLRDSALAGSPLTAWLSVTDSKGQMAQTPRQPVYVPDRRFRSTDAALIDAQRARLKRDADNTHQVAIMLRRMAEQHLEETEDVSVDAGMVLAYAVAYHRLTGLSLNDPLPPWPLMPAEPEAIDAAIPLLRSLAVRIDDRKLHESEANFARATATLERSLSDAASPRERQAALWQWRGAVRTHLVALFLDAIRYGRPFLIDLEASAEGRPQGGMPRAILRQTRQINADLMAEDFTAARQRIDAVEDALNLAIAGPVTGARKSGLSTFASLSGWTEDTKALMLNWQRKSPADLKNALAGLLHEVALSPLPDLSNDQRRALQNDLEAMIRVAEKAVQERAPASSLLPMMADFHNSLLISARGALSQHLKLKPRLLARFNQPAISAADQARANALLRAVPHRISMHRLTPFYRAMERMKVIDLAEQANPEN